MISMNGASVPSFAAFRQMVAGWRVGDSVRVVVSRPTGRYSATVVMGRRSRSPRGSARSTGRVRRSAS